MTNTKINATTGRSSPWERRLHTSLDRLFKYEPIPADGPVQLHRWTVARLPNGAALYIHHFVRSEDRHPHDHPKPFATVGLKGGYTENSATPSTLDGPTRRNYRAPWFRTFPAHHIHTIELEPGTTCWTLAFVGPRRRRWGFFVPDSADELATHPAIGPRHRWIDHRDYAAVKDKLPDEPEPANPEPSDP